jgi:hypothetical protein
MIGVFFALLGYVKVPTAAVQLSTYQEFFLEELLEVIPDTDTPFGRTVMQQLESQKTLTAFLRSGRLVHN